MSFEKEPSGQNSDARQKILEAVEQQDVTELLRLGFENFMRLLCDRPLFFQAFLNYTGSFLDQLILDVEKAEKLHYVGGKLILRTGKADAVSLLAELYFQNEQKSWIVKKKEGAVSKSRFRDWDSALELAELREKRILEFPIEPPTSGLK